MKVRVTAGERQLTVDLPDTPGSAPTLDGARVRCDLAPVRPGVYSLIVEGRSFEVALEASDADAGEVLAQVDGVKLSLLVEDERRRAREASSGGREAKPGAGTSVTVAAPMPGRVVAVPVEPGATVERGQTVVVLEAMKMESALNAPHPGRVVEVLVKPGQTVQQRQPLVRIEG